MNIPKTIKQAVGRLTSLDKIVTASEWERAAIVWAFTRDGGQGGRPKAGEPVANDKFTATEFAKQGIVGLKSHVTVQMYRDAWKQAMKDGAPDIGPGDPFVVPVTAWPPMHQGGSASLKDLRKDLIADPVKTITKIITEDGEVSESAVEAIAEGIVKVPQTKKAVVEMILKITPTTTHTILPSAPTNWNVELYDHLNGVLDALKALREGQFTLDSFNAQLLGLVGHVLPEVAAAAPGAVNETADAMFADIEDFLKNEARS